MQGYSCGVPIDSTSTESAVLHDLGISAFGHGNIKVALRFISRACKDPKAPAIWHRNHAEILDRRGDSDGAEAAVRLALKREPDCVRAWETLGTILSGRGKLGQACACYEKAVRLEPAFFEALNNLAVTLNRLGRHGEAEACYRRALDLAPENAEIHLNLAKLLGELGRHREGLNIVRQVLKRCPDMMRAQSLAAEITHSLQQRAPNSSQSSLLQ